MTPGLVVCYHGASDQWRHLLALPPAMIEQQVRRLLARRFRPVSAADVLSRRGRILHVTFDDSLRSILRVLPRLEALRVPVTVFVCSGLAGGRLDVPELREELAANPEELRTLTWDELRGLAERGVELGAHTVSHPHLPRLGDGELLAELRESRERLEDELGRPCRFVAYPYGEGDSRVFAAARSAGFEGGFMLLSGDARDRYAFPRADLYPRDVGAAFRLKTEPALQAAFRRLHVARRARAARRRERRSIP